MNMNMDGNTNMNTNSMNLNTNSNSDNRQPGPKRPLLEATCVYDFYLDIPHPAFSIINDPARIIEPPGQCHPGCHELFEASNISRIAMFAFPDYDSENDRGE